MRLLFVSGTTVGGSGRSQRELAARLVEKGHQVLFVADDERAAFARRWAYGHLSDLAVRLNGRPGARFVRWVEALPGRRAATQSVGGLNHLITPIPENAVARAIASFRPDVVVGNSVLRLTWRKVQVHCAAMQIATVLYVREVASMNHFLLGSPPAHGIVANARSLADEVERMGYSCAMLPSVIEVGVTRVGSTRRAALVINPLPSHGIELIWQLAARLPEIQFVVQESWPLSKFDLDKVTRAAALLANVEFRRAAPPSSSLYRDARVLLVPHRIDNRPRVIAEAHANRIPVVASHTPGLEEATGMGGLLIDMNDVDGWERALRRLWSDQQWYDQLVLQAAAHSARPEIDPVRVADAFRQLAEQAINDARAASLP